jgi:hypothetical protein
VRFRRKRLLRQPRIAGVAVNRQPGGLLVTVLVGTDGSDSSYQVVTMVGDEVLFVTDKPADAAEIALRLAGTDRDRKGLTALRVGMATGRMLTRFRDV